MKKRYIKALHIIFGTLVLLAVAVGVSLIHPRREQNLKLESPGNIVDFFSQFQDSLKTGDAGKIANDINFPFYIHSTPRSKEEFINDTSGTVNFFDKSYTDQILKSHVDEFLVYENKNLIPANSSPEDLSLIPGNTSVYELDIINKHGGPAMRLMFAKGDNGVKLYCLTQ